MRMIFVYFIIGGFLIAIVISQSQYNYQRIRIVRKHYTK